VKTTGLQQNRNYNGGASFRRFLCMVSSVSLLCGCTTAKETAYTADPNATALMDAVTASGTSETVIEDDLTWIDRYLDSYMNEGDTLPSETSNGTAITWSVVSGNAELSDNAIHKTDTASEYEPIVLHALLANGEEQDFGNILLLAGYVMTYFTKEDDDKETLKLAYSYDGEYWYHLNDDKSVVQATLGTKRLRDPSVVRRKDGSFTVIATEGYDNPSIYAFDTADFVTYTNERLIQVNTSSASLSMSESQAWAPEGFYDRRSDAYVLYWSSPDDGGMFYNTSSDLETVSEPASLLDAGFTVIDGTIVKEGAHYSIILKDEREPMEEYSQLFIGYSDTDYLHFTRFGNPITGHQSEGPFVLKRKDHDNDVLVYYDDYTRYQFQALWGYNVYEDTLVDLGSDNMLVPMSEPSHASAIPVTWKELERLKAVYGNTSDN
jgi:hypothetical protein